MFAAELQSTLFLEVTAMRGQLVSKMGIVFQFVKLLVSVLFVQKPLAGPDTEGGIHFPMQNFEKMFSSRSSVVIVPVISPK